MGGWVETIACMDAVVKRKFPALLGLEPHRMKIISFS
jgi:hypothetical protein